MKPIPNYSTEMTFDELAEFVDKVRSGEWSWSKNSACKYIKLTIDTRSGVTNLYDRDGNPMSASQMTWQYEPRVTEQRPEYKSRKPDGGIF